MIGKHGVIENDSDKLSHAICMAIRHGLYGYSASDEESLSDQINGIENALNNIADGLQSVATAINNKNKGE